MVLEPWAGSRRAPRLRLLSWWAGSCGANLRVTPRPHPCGAVMGGPPPAGPGPPQAGPHIVPGLRLLLLQASSCETDLRVPPRPRPCGAAVGGPLRAGPGPPRAGPGPPRAGPRIMYREGRLALADGCTGHASVQIRSRAASRTAQDLCAVQIRSPGNS